MLLTSVCQEYPPLFTPSLCSGIIGSNAPVLHRCCCSSTLFLLFIVVAVLHQRCATLLSVAGFCALLLPSAHRCCTVLHVVVHVGVAQFCTSLCTGTLCGGIVAHSNLGEQGAVLQQDSSLSLTSGSHRRVAPLPS